MARRARLKRLAGAALALAASCAAIFSGAAQDSRIAGVWTVTLDKFNRACTMMLRTNAAGHDEASRGLNFIGMPYGCRRALPFLGAVAGWRMTTDRQIEFVGKAGETILVFGADAQGRAIEAQSPAGLVSMQRIDGRAVSGLQRTAAAIETERKAAATRIVHSAPWIRLDPTALAGRYRFLRLGEKDTGCVMELLADAAPDFADARKARLVLPCADAGITIFTPVAWVIEGAAITLIGSRRQRIIFDAARDGSFGKAVGQGEPLFFRKAPQN